MVFQPQQASHSFDTLDSDSLVCFLKRVAYEKPCWVACENRPIHDQRKERYWCSPGLPTQGVALCQDALACIYAYLLCLHLPYTPCAACNRSVQVTSTSTFLLSSTMACGGCAAAAVPSGSEAYAKLYPEKSSDNVLRLGNVVPGGQRASCGTRRESSGPALKACSIRSILLSCACSRHQHVVVHSSRGCDRGTAVQAAVGVPAEQRAG